VARPRKRPAAAKRPKSSRARRPSRAASPPKLTPTQQRNARVERLGFSSYWAFRKQQVGQLLPFLRSLREGDLIIMPYGIAGVERDERGFYVEIVKLVLDAASGRERWWTLRNLSRRQLELVIDEERARGASWSPSPSQDQRRILREDEVDGGY